MSSLYDPFFRNGRTTDSFFASAHGIGSTSSLGTAVHPDGNVSAVQRALRSRTSQQGGDPARFAFPTETHFSNGRERSPINTRMSPAMIRAISSATSPGGSVSDRYSRSPSSSPAATRRPPSSASFNSKHTPPAPLERTPSKLNPRSWFGSEQQSAEVKL